MARRRKASRPGVIITGGVIATGLVLVILLVLLLGRREHGGAEVVRTSADDALTVSEGGSGGLVGRIANATEEFSTVFDAAQRVQQLEAENAKLTRWREIALMLAERSERYEKLLNMPPESFGLGLEPYGAIGARLILDSGGPLRRTLLANAGHDQGVRLGYVALNEHGMVGRVVSVGRRSARILLLDDYNSRVPVIGEQSRVRAVMIGDVGARANLEIVGANLEPPKLEFLVGATALRAGERIITSGDGGLFPRGVLVGWAEGRRNGDWRVRLASSRAPIDYVRLVPFAPAPAPEAEPVPESAKSIFLAAKPERPAPAAAAPVLADPLGPAVAPRAPLPSTAAVAPEAVAAGIAEE